MTMDILQKLLPFPCSDSNSLVLLLTVTKEERKDVLFAMPTNKSPGPGGLNAEFYKSTWGIIGSEFVTAIQAFLIKGFFLRG